MARPNQWAIPDSGLPPETTSQSPCRRSGTSSRIRRCSRNWRLCTPLTLTEGKGADPHAERWSSRTRSVRGAPARCVVRMRAWCLSAVLAHPRSDVTERGHPVLPRRERTARTRTAHRAWRMRTSVSSASGCVREDDARTSQMSAEIRSRLVCWTNGHRRIFGETDDPCNYCSGYLIGAPRC